MALCYFAQWTIGHAVPFKAFESCLRKWDCEAGVGAECGGPGEGLQKREMKGIWTARFRKSVDQFLVDVAMHSEPGGSVARVRVDRPDALPGEDFSLPKAPGITSILIEAFELEIDEDDRLPIVLVSGEEVGASSPGRLTDCLTQRTLGMASVGIIDPVEASRLCIREGLRADGRAGTVLLGITDETGTTHWTTSSATASRRDPDALARRVQGRVLAGATHRDHRMLESALESFALGDSAAELDELASYEEGLVRRLTKLESDLQDATRERDLAFLDLERLECDLADQEVVARRYQRLAWQQGLFDTGEPEVDEEDLDLDECIDVLAMAPEVLGFLTVTAEEKITAQLDQHSLNGVWAKRAWRLLRGLNDYARLKRAGEYAGGLGEFCRNPPLGSFPLPWKSVALSESETVERSPELRQKRVFTVPLAVARSGYEAMFAHLKVDNNSPAPRIHFLEQGSDTGHSVVVGYFGPHLPTGQFR